MDKVGEITSDVVQGRKKKDPPLKLSQLIDKDEAYCKSLELSGSTISNNRVALQHFISTPKDKPVCDVTHGDVVERLKMVATADL